MRGALILAMSIAWAVNASSVIAGQDLSSYRGFQLGMSLDAVAQQTGIVSEARVVHQRPELIQELTWEPPRSLGSPPPGESVRKVLLSFYNGQLFRIVVSYERGRTEGLTVEDMVDALSVTYGPALLPATEIASSVSRVSHGKRPDRGALGRPAACDQPRSSVLRVHLWTGDVFKAVGCPGPRCQRRSDPAERTRSSRTSHRTPKAARRRGLCQAREGQDRKQRDLSTLMPLPEGERVPR